MLRFLTSGESHGQALSVIVDGIPAGLPLEADRITHDLRRRQLGYGRGRRMAIETDTAEILSGVRAGETIGAPIGLLIRNRDWENWERTMAVQADPPETARGPQRPAVSRPRPGHADLAGAAKYDREDLRDVLERASARETAARVAAGAIARRLLEELGVRIASHIIRIEDVVVPDPHSITFDRIAAVPIDSPFRCVDPALEAAMIDRVDAARDAGDTLGGAFEVVAHGVPIGLGSYAQWDRKLDGRLAQALMSIPAIKAVGIGIGVEVAGRPGSRVHDEILRRDDDTFALTRPTNNAGGLEGGVTNGEDLRVTAYMKPISTLMKPLRSVDLATMTEAPATVERSDVCAVPAAAVVGEAMVCFALADACVEHFGGDTLAAVKQALHAASERLRTRFGHRGVPTS